MYLVSSDATGEGGITLDCVSSGIWAKACVKTSDNCDAMMRMAFFIMLVLYSWLSFDTLMVNWLQDTNYFNITNKMKENNYGRPSNLLNFLPDVVMTISRSMQNIRP